MTTISIKSNGRDSAGSAEIPVNIKSCIKEVLADLSEWYPDFHWDIEYSRLYDGGVIWGETKICDKCMRDYSHYFYVDNKYMDVLPRREGRRYEWETQYPNHNNYKG
jgi:hypothetical protein